MSATTPSTHLHHHARTRAIRNRLRLARYFASVCRVSTLRLSTRCLQGIEGSFIVSRRFFNRELYLDVGRGNPQCMLYLQGERYIEERHIIKDLVRPGMEAIDIGANIGYYTLMLASYVGPRGAVLCLEPEPDNLVELRRNVQLNRLPNVTVIDAAAASVDGTAGLSRGLNAYLVEQHNGEMVTRTTRLDSLDSRNAGFIKIDVEGFELEVLLGARGLLEKQRPNLFVEVHPQFQKDKTETREVIRLISEYYQNIVVWTRRRGSIMNTLVEHYCEVSPFQSAPLAEVRDDLPSEIFWVAAKGV